MNVIKHFLVVGVIERFSETMHVLERELPHLLGGIETEYLKAQKDGTKNQSQMALWSTVDAILHPVFCSGFSGQHRNAGKKRSSVLNATAEAFLINILEKEMRFYNFINERLSNQVRKLSAKK